MKWFKRFFVLRDSFLLSYNLQKSDFTTEPRSSIHLGNCKVILVQPDKNIDRDFCFSITTETGDQFLFSASSDAERQAWLDDIYVARNITHATMVKLAVENQCLAEERGVGEIAREASTSSLAIFSNPTYVQETPLTGGMEGWLSTTGFNASFKQAAPPLVGKKVSPWKRCYFMLRDSHILMFNAGDMLSKPRGVMYLVGTTVEVLPDEEEEIPFRFVVGSKACGDMIELASSSLKSLNRWKQALAVGARVTYPDYRLLEQERQVLANLVLTPRAPTPRGPGGQLEMREHVPSVLDEEHDLLGNTLAPGAVQPYDEHGIPLLRNPDGILINAETSEAVSITTPRYSSQGEQLDAFNRPLPPGAAPMFDEKAQPIGVGPDGQHYTPDGEIVDKFAPHFDAQGNQLPQETVSAADQIAPTIAVAVKVRAKLKGEAEEAEVVDALGRTFRQMDENTLVTEDGQKVPTTARRVEVDGKLVSYEEATQSNVVKQASVDETSTLTIKMEMDDGDIDVGEIEVTSATKLSDVRESISGLVAQFVPEFVFLVNGVALGQKTEKLVFAAKHCPEIFVRGKELKTEKPAEVFKASTAKVSTMIQTETKKKQEEDEFLNIMSQVKNKSFLRSVGRDLTK